MRKLRFLPLILLSVFLWSFPVESEEVKPAPAPSVESSVVPSASPSGASSAPATKTVRDVRASHRSSYVVDPAAFEDMKRAREENEAKSKQLAEKEAELKAREQALNEEFKKLKKAREDLAEAQGIKKEDDEAKLNKVVETLLIMNPKAASKLLSTLDEDLAVAAIYKMDSNRLGKILNVMETGTSSKLTELMVGIVRSKKGGDLKDDRKNEQLASARQPQSQSVSQQLAEGKQSGGGQPSSQPSQSNSN